MFIRWCWQSPHFRVEVLRDTTRSHWYHRVVSASSAVYESAHYASKEAAVQMATKIADDAGWSLCVID